MNYKRRVTGMCGDSDQIKTGVLTWSIKPRQDPEWRTVEKHDFKATGICILRFTTNERMQSSEVKPQQQNYSDVIKLNCIDPKFPRLCRQD